MVQKYSEPSARPLSPHPSPGFKSACVDTTPCPRYCLPAGTVGFSIILRRIFCPVDSKPPDLANTDTYGVSSSASTGAGSLPSVMMTVCRLCCNSLCRRGCEPSKQPRVTSGTSSDVARTLGEGERPVYTFFGSQNLAE